MYCIVSPFSKTFDDIGLIYLVPNFLSGEIQVGQVVEIPIKEKIEIGIVLSIIEKIPGNIEKEKVRSLIGVKNKNILLNSYSSKLIPWIANHYFTPIHNALNLFFPKNLKEKIQKDTLQKDIGKNNIPLTYTSNYKLKLSEEQSKAYTQIQNSQNKKILLYGITGSGKTQIYIKLIEEQLKHGKQSLLLIPEIILTNQIAERIENAFGENVIVINSSISSAKKTQHWIRIWNNTAKVIIGTRSALFYPFQNLGLIIIDEEHDNSYISDTAPRYNTKEVAEKIIEPLNAKLIFASGTPSISSMYKGVNKKYQIVNLLKKYE